MLETSTISSSLEKPQEHNEFSRDSHHQHKTILVVEDDIGLNNALDLRLQKLNFFVVREKDGQKALEKIRAIIPDLILLDFHLPRLSGNEICRAIREDENPEIASIPIIMVVGKSAFANGTTIIDGNVNCFITKPYNFEDLLREMLQIFLFQK